MSEHVLLVALGPVQGFIAQARRTRDLWYGSHILSELARAVARHLAGDGARLIFPALEAGDPELAACLSPVRGGDRPPLSIGNKVLAVLPGELDPETTARGARDSVHRFWREEIAGPVRDRCQDLLAHGIDAVWDEQVRTFIEFSAAWAELGEYETARSTVEMALAGRKNLRDFEQWRCLRGSVPKSSLDGGRETVLRSPDLRDPRLSRKYRIGEGEQLDSIGLIKRAGGSPEQFVPIVNVAMASWLALAEREACDELTALKGACRKVDVARVSRRDLPWTERFPFDASVLFPSQWETVFREQGLDLDPKAWGARYALPLLSRLSEPYPYVACLMADGDHMGATIGKLGALSGGYDAHQCLSRNLADFTTQVRAIVERDHSGSLVYCGGDEVLAFLAIPEVLGCAEALRHAFSDAMRSACPSLSPEERPTLSVGIGIGHLMESMGDILNLAREAQRTAKSASPPDTRRDRNALAVVLEKRTGTRRLWRAQWSEWNGDPIGRLRSDITLLEKGRLSTRKLHAIARLLRCLPEPHMVDDPVWSRVLGGEVGRTLRSVHGSEPGLEPLEAGLVLDDAMAYEQLHQGVAAWIDRLLTARAFAEAGPRMRPSEGGRRDG